MSQETPKPPRQQTDDSRGTLESTLVGVGRFGYGLLTLGMGLLPQQTRQHVESAVRELSYGVVTLPRDFAAIAAAEVDRWDAEANGEAHPRVHVPVPAAAVAPVTATKPTSLVAEAKPATPPPAPKPAPAAPVAEAKPATPPPAPKPAPAAPVAEAKPATPPPAPKPAPAAPVAEAKPATPPPAPKPAPAAPVAEAKPATPPPAPKPAPAAPVAEAKPATPPPAPKPAPAAPVAEAKPAKPAKPAPAPAAPVAETKPAKPAKPAPAPAAPVAETKPATPPPAPAPAAPVAETKPATPPPAPADTASETGITIAHLEYNPPGRDRDGEYVLIRNSGATSMDLTGWTLSDGNARHSFTFPRFSLAPGAEVKLWTRSGNANAGNLFWASRTAIWNKAGDTATLCDASGNVIARYTYQGQTKPRGRR